jgi:hypothetical protein
MLTAHGGAAQVFATVYSFWHDPRQEWGALRHYLWRRQQWGGAQSLN